MKKISLLCIALFLFSQTVFALGKKDVRAIIEEAYPGAKVTEIEKESYKGKRVWEVDFKHDGKAFEAIISLEGEIVKVGIDD